MPAYRALFGPSDPAVATFIARYDSMDDSASQDGIVTRDEYRKSGHDGWPAALARLDKTKDGVVSAADGAPSPKAPARALAKWLVDLTGPSPRPRPRLKLPSGSSPLQDKPEAIARGRALHVRHCAGCHGTRADGNGPAAMFFPEHPPRNFLRGEYRYRSTPVGQPPLDLDLFRTIRRGLGGSMPAWPSFSDGQVWALVEYLKSNHPEYVPRELFISGDATHSFVKGTGGERDAFGIDLAGGRVRKRGGRWLWNGRPIADGGPEATVRTGDRVYTFRLGRAVFDWMDEARPRAVKVPAPPFAYSRESAAKGAKVYREFGCAKCHGDEGGGDGPAARHSRGSLGQVVAPADYTRGLKVGFRPRALVRLFLTGLHGTPMPGYGESFALAESAPPAAAPWHLAHFVMRQAGYRDRTGK